VDRWKVDHYWFGEYRDSAGLSKIHLKDLYTWRNLLKVGGLYRGLPKICWEGVKLNPWPKILHFFMRVYGWQGQIPKWKQVIMQWWFAETGESWNRVIRPTIPYLVIWCLIPSSFSNISLHCRDCNLSSNLILISFSGRMSSLSSLMGCKDGTFRFPSRCALAPFQWNLEFSKGFFSKTISFFWSYSYYYYVS